MTEQNSVQDGQNPPEDAPETPRVDETTTETSEAAETGTEPAAEGTEDTEPESYPAEYVRKLRDEAAAARVKVKDRDTLAQRLHTELVRATGRLADPTDLPFDADHLTDPDKIIAAVDELLARKPHLASRRPAGDIGQGQSSDAGGVSLSGLLRARA